jgi:hypothetical protein
MTAISPLLEVTTKLVEALSPLNSEERRKVLQAAFALLGESPMLQSSEQDKSADRSDLTSSSLPVRARSWMRQYGIPEEKLFQVFNLSNGRAEIIASVPGKDTKERMLNCYVLTGIASLLSAGEFAFEDKAARETCRASGCYDANNHSSYLKGKGNVFSGTKEKGWVLTAPGQKWAAELIEILGS